MLIPINDQLQLQDKKKERKLTLEEISNHLRQVTMEVIQTQAQATITTMMIKEETIARAEEANVRTQSSKTIGS